MNHVNLNEIAEKVHRNVPKFDLTTDQLVQVTKDYSNSESYLDVLLVIFGDDRFRDIRFLALMALVQAKDKKLRDFWLGFVVHDAELNTSHPQNDYTNFEQHAVRALGDIANEADLDLLIKVARGEYQKSQSVREAAAAALGNFENEKAKKALVNLINDSETSLDFAKNVARLLKFHNSETVLYGLDAIASKFMVKENENASLGKLAVLAQIKETYNQLPSGLRSLDLEKYSSLQEHVGEKKSEGCFIATAIYGDKNEPQVQLLRIWRDEVLHTTPLGRCLSKLYYFVGPHLAWFVERGLLPSRFIKSLLDRFVEKIR
jgi:hypothetical protein